MALPVILTVGLLSAIAWRPHEATPILADPVFVDVPSPTVSAEGLESRYREPPSLRDVWPATDFEAPPTPTVAFTPTPTIPRYQGTSIEAAADLECEWLRPYVEAYDWPAEEALAVADHESDCRNVRGIGGGIGPFQLCPPDEAYFDVAVGVSLAYAKWLDGGRSFDRHWRRFWP